MACLALTSSALVAALAGCGGSTDPANTLVIYNGQHEQTANALLVRARQAIRGLTRGRMNLSLA